MNTKIKLKLFLTVIIMLMLSISIFAQVSIEKRSFDVEDGGNLYLKTEIGGIKINSHSKSKADVNIYLKGDADKDDYEKFKKNYSIEFNHQGANLEIICKKTNYDNWLSRMFRGKNFRVVFEVTLPQKYDIDVKTSGGGISVKNIKGLVETKTSGGGLHFQNIKGKIDGKTSGGGINASKCIGDIKISTSGGGIKINDCKGDVDASTSGGGITVKKIYGNLNASTSGGSIYAEILEQPKENCSLTTSGGGIKVKLKKDIHLDLDASTSSGHVECEFPITSKGKVKSSRLKGEINGGGPKLRLRSSAGSVKILEY
ncbi:MAG: hypothetical protein CR986_02310 [Ignavibacteriae bacterium]|nr:MAG: hypothetical protein CR986_02310 [Ignavibacteriota bacterium]